jgi:hypothetical protein
VAEGERIARNEEAIRGIRDDMADIVAQVRGMSTRVRSLENVAESFLAAQRLNRQKEERQYRRVANAVQFGSMVMAVALVALSLITLLTNR